MQRIQLGAVAVAALLHTPVAQAQSSVQIYGIIDTAIEYVSDVNAQGDHLVRMPNLSGGMLPSRLGFRGSEEIGRDLKVIFVLENGFGPDSGSINIGNRLFGRQAWVGLSGSWGAVTVGRNYTMLFHSFVDVDVIGPSQFSVGAMDPYLPNTRVDNSIAYKGTFSGVTVGATYSLGRDTSNSGGPPGSNCGGESSRDSRACRQWSALLRYDGSNWGATLAHDTFRGGAGAFAPFSPISSAASDSRTHAAGYWRIGHFKFAGGYLDRENEGNAATPRTRLGYVGLSWQASSAWSIDAQVGRLDVRNSENRSDLVTVRAAYNLSKRTAVYAMAGWMGNDGMAAVPLSAGSIAAPGVSQRGVLTGIRHIF